MHFDEKKSTKKTTFPGKKHHHEKKHKETLLFFKNTFYEECNRSMLDLIICREGIYKWLTA